MNHYRISFLDVNDNFRYMDVAEDTPEKAKGLFLDAMGPMVQRVLQVKERIINNDEEI